MERDEERMVAIWRDVFRAGDIGLDTDLVETGADSLNAMTLISRISAEFGVEVEMWDLFDAATPRGALHLVQNA